MSLLPVGMAASGDPGFRRWIAAHPDLPAEAATPWGDADGDGIANFVEYALDRSALERESPGHPGGMAQGPVLRFHRARPEVAYIVEGSHDLKTWTPLATNPGAVGDQVEFAVDDPIGSGSSLYLRLRVEGKSDEEILAEGMAAWRKPDQDGLRCADCHAPQAYDLALFSFNRTDVRRAGAPHLSESDNDAIHDMLEVLRRRHPPPRGLKDVRTFRPLQPGGGEVLGGVGSPVSVRDAAFGQWLKERLLIAHTRITTLQQARAAAAELVALDLFDVPVGVPFNLWSRSALREGATVGGEIAEWVPGIALQPKAGMEAAWFALHDAYAAEPNEARMWAIFDAAHVMLQPDPVNFVSGSTSAAWADLAKAQYLSNLLFQHDVLERSRGEPGLFAKESGLRPFAQRVRDPAYDQPELNPFWHVGDKARVVSKEFSQLPLRHRNTLFVDGTRVTASHQIQDLQMPWMYVGWLFDNSLQHSGNTNPTLFGEYFLGQLWSGTAEDLPKGTGYRSHYVFFNAAHQYRRAFLSGAWNPARSVTHGRGPYFTLAKNYYLAYGRWKKELVVPGYPEADADYKRLLGNHLRMNLLIHRDEIEKLGIVITGSNSASSKQTFRDNLLSTADLYGTILAWTDPDRLAEDLALVDAYKATVLAYPYD